MKENSKEQPPLTFKEQSHDECGGKEKTDEPQQNREYEQLKQAYLNTASTYHPSSTAVQESDGEDSDIPQVRPEIDEEANEGDQRQFVAYRSTDGRTYFDPTETDERGTILDKQWGTRQEKWKWLKSIDDGNVIVGESPLFQDANHTDYKYFRGLNSVDQNTKRHVQASSHAVENVATKFGIKTTHPIVIEAKKRLIEINDCQKDVDRVQGMVQTAIVLVTTEHRRFNRRKNPHLSEWIEKVRESPSEAIKELKSQSNSDTADHRDLNYQPLEDSEAFHELLDDCGGSTLTKMDLDTIRRSLYGSEYVPPQVAEEIKCS